MNEKLIQRLEQKDTAKLRRVARDLCEFLGLEVMPPEKDKELPEYIAEANELLILDFALDYDGLSVETVQMITELRKKGV